LGNAVIGRVVLAGAEGSLPDLVAVFPPPVPLEIRGAAGLTDTGVGATFDDLPDLPLTRLTVRLAGGPDSVLTSTPALCTSQQRLGGDTRAHNGVEAAISAVVTVAGCQAQPAPPAPAPGPAAPPASEPASGAVLGALSANGVRTTLRYSARRGLRLTVNIPAAMRAARTLDLALPRGLTLNTRRLRRVHTFAGGRGRKVTAATRSALRVTVPTGARTWTVAIEAGALRKSGRLGRAGITLRDGVSAPVVLRVATAV
jgi:hypothetical protein